MRTNEDSDEGVDEAAANFMDEYWPGWSCSFYRCDHYRLAEEGSPAWCWLRHGIGAEGREAECPGYKRAVRLKLKTPNKEVRGAEQASPAERPS